jgi:hypothetical protein
MVQFPLNIGFIHPTVVNWQQTHSYIWSTSTLPLVPCYIFRWHAYPTRKDPTALHSKQAISPWSVVDKELMLHIRQSTQTMKMSASGTSHPNVAFSRLIVAFINPFDIQMHVSWYYAIDKKHVHIPGNLNAGCSSQFWGIKHSLQKNALSHACEKLCVSLFSSQTEWTTCVQILQEYGRTSYLVHDTKNAWFPWTSD